MPIFITDLGGAGRDIYPAAVQERLRPFDAQILKVGKRRFAKHLLARPLQSTRARRQRHRRFLRREPALEVGNGRDDHPLVHASLSPELYFDLGSPYAYLALERAEPWGVWGGELFVQGVVVPRKRPRGRPRKTEIAA